MKNSKLYLYNSLTRKKEKFIPLKKGHVGMYTCGPTIYSFPTIGNWRTYILSDLLYRTLKFNAYEVKHVMNLTDVGHLSGDNLGDASSGEDRMAKAAEKEGVDAWTIADKYGSDFLNSLDKFNIIKPSIIPKATDHIKEQIKLIKEIESNGLTYKTSDGIYFDVKAYERQGNKYGKLSDIDKMSMEGSRLVPNPEKKDPRDFALWKFFATGQKRHNMEWKSPWGVGYPGWHIECSAMSMKYLGEQFDIHLGGEDLKSTHHPNEIAQSESATKQKPFVKYWVHGGFLQVDGGRMGKSLGNAYSIHDIIEEGYDPLAFRMLTMGTHYRKPLNFTWEALQAAQNSLEKLYNHAPEISEHTFDDDERIKLKTQKYFLEFLKAINDDINMPQALRVVWEMLNDKTLDGLQKALYLSEFDQVMGLEIYSDPRKKLGFYAYPIEEGYEDSLSIKVYDEILVREDIQLLTPELLTLIITRQEKRKKRDFDKADKIKMQIEEMGYKIEDLPTGIKIIPV